MSWFGFGGSTDKKDRNQTASLVAHDDMEEEKQRRGANSGGSVLAAPSPPKTTKKATSTASSTNSPTKTRTKGSGIGGVKSQKTVQAAQHNADQAAQLASQMAAAMDWWKNGSADASAAAVDGEPLNLDLDPLDSDFLASPDDFAPIDLDAEVGFHGFDILSTLRDRELTYERLGDKKGSSSRQVEARTQQMRDALSWWSTTAAANQKQYSLLDEPLQDYTAAAAQEMQEVVQWWSDSGRIYKSNDKARKAGKIRKLLVSKYRTKADNAEKLAAKMQQSLLWYQKHAHSYQKSYEAVQVQLDQMKKVNHLFDWWTDRDLPLDYKFDMGKDPRGAEKLARDLEKRMAEFLQLGQIPVFSDDVSPVDPFYKFQHALVDIAVKDIMYDPYKAQKEIDMVLNWWKVHPNFDPHAVEDVSAHDLAMYRKALTLFQQWGVPIPTNTQQAERLAKELQAAVNFWGRQCGGNASVDEGDLEPYEREQLRKIRHVAVELRGCLTPEQASEAMSTLRDDLQWWRLFGAKYDAQSTSDPSAIARWDRLTQIFTDWKFGTDIAENAQKDLEEAIDWWLRHSSMSLKEADYVGDELVKFKKVKQAMLEWRGQGVGVLAPEAAALYVTQMEKTFDRWEEIKDWTKFMPMDEFVAANLLDIVRGIVAKDFPDDEMMSYMRNPAVRKELRDLFQEWKSMGGKVNLIDMPGIKSDPTKAKKMQALLDAMLAWQRNRAHAELDDVEEAEYLAKEVLKGFQWYKRDGKTFDAKKARAEQEEQMGYLRNVRDALGWLQDPDGIRGLDVASFSILDLPGQDALEQAKGLEEQLGWFRKVGKNVSAEAINEEEMYEKAMRLGQWWGDYSKPYDSKRAKAAAEEIERLLVWRRNLNDGHNGDDPDRFALAAKLMSVWSQEKNGSLENEKKLSQDLLDALSWWRNSGFQCDPDKLSDMDKAQFFRLKNVAQWMEEAKKSTNCRDEFDALAWTRDTPSNTALPDLDGTMNDVMGWFGQKASSIPKLPKSNEGKLEKVRETVYWWERNDSTAPPKKSELAKLHDIHAILGPLMNWWNETGKDYAVNDGHMVLDEADNVDKKLQAAFKWLEKSLEKGKAPQGMLENVNNMATALNWLRGKDASHGYSDPDSYSVGSNVAGKPILGVGTTPEEQRAKEMEEALNWLRSNDLNYDQMDELSLATYNKIESMVPGADRKSVV